MRRRSERGQLAAEAEREFVAFVTRDERPLLRFAYLLTGDRQDAEDLVQSALLRCATQWPAAGRNPEAYARTVLVNLARDRWRLRRRRPRHEDLDGWNERELPIRSDGLDGRQGRSEAVLDRHVLVDACRLLPLQQRAVLVLRFWEDRSVEDTAALLGCSPGSVKTHTHRALARLRQLLPDDARTDGHRNAGDQAAPHRADRHQADRDRAERQQAERRPAEQHRAEQHRAEQHRADQHRAGGSPDHHSNARGERATHCEPKEASC